MSAEPDLFSDIPDPFADVSARASASPSLTAASSPEHAGPDRASVERRRLAAFVASLAVVGAWVAFEGVRTLGSPLVVAWIIGMPALAAAVAAVTMMKQGRLGLGLDARTMNVLLGVAGFAFAASAFYAPENAETGFTLKSTLVCGAMGLAVAALPFALAFGAYRDALRTGAVSRMAACGIAAGALAAVALRLHCPHDGPLHVLLGHGAAPALLGTLALALRRR